MKKVPKSKCFIVPQLHPLFVSCWKNWNWRLNSILLQPRYYCLRGSTSRNRNCFLHQHRHIWNQFYLPSTKILLLEGVNIGNIDYIVTWFCCSIEWQHRNSLPRWMSFLSLDSLNESPFFGMVLHNKFLMVKLGKEYILTLSMKSESNPCPIVINSTLISTILTMEVSKLRKKVQKTCFHQKLFRYYLEFFRSTST